ncbi:MAG: quinone oxidoreductase [Steroidobacteraceae bacterium]
MEPRAILIREHGSADVLRWEGHDPGRPGPGEVLVRHTAVGVNYIDVYDRSGLYPTALPAILGREAAGTVAALGRGVRGFKLGERVAYVHSEPGTYAQLRCVPATRLVHLPRSVSDEQAAALMLKGLTAQYLLRRTYPLRRGQTALVHAAAGGVGLLLCQWARALGARVIGVVGHEDKVGFARRHGCNTVLVAGRDGIAAGVGKATRGAMADVVYDSVGHDTFMESLDCLKPRGMMVSFGNASGPPPPISALELSRRGSLFLTRPSLFHYIGTRAELDAAARELFRAIARHKVRIHIGQRYALAEAAQAHRDLEARRTVGSTVLLP